MTNREFLLTLTNKKLAEFHHQYDCPPNYCNANADIDCDLRTCEECWAEWLGLPYADPDGLVDINDTAWWERASAPSPMTAAGHSAETDEEE